MPIRVQNVAAGFVDKTGTFHPIRGSKDYTGPGRKGKLKYKVRTIKGKKVRVHPTTGKRLGPHKAATGATPLWRELKRAVGQIGKYKPKAAGSKAVKGRKRNPAPRAATLKMSIPRGWTRAKVRRTASGKVQVLIQR